MLVCLHSLTLSIQTHMHVHSMQFMLKYFLTCLLILSFLCFQSLTEINLHLAEAQICGGKYSSDCVFELKDGHQKATICSSILYL